MLSSSSPFFVGKEAGLSFFCALSLSISIALLFRMLLLRSCANMNVDHRNRNLNDSQSSSGIFCHSNTCEHHVEIANISYFGDKFLVVNSLELMYHYKKGFYSS